MTTVNMTISESILRHHYNARTLLLSYAAALFATVIILIMGLHAMWCNGIGHSSSFSGLLSTTRNKDLDELAHGQCLGAMPLDKELAKQELMFGSLLEENHGEMSGVRHAAFGLEGTVTRLRKDEKYM